MGFRRNMICSHGVVSYLDLLILLEGTVNNWQNGTTTYGISGYPLHSITLAARQAAGCPKMVP